MAPSSVYTVDLTCAVGVWNPYTKQGMLALVGSKVKASLLFLAPRACGIAHHNRRSRHKDGKFVLLGNITKLRAQ